MRSLIRGVIVLVRQFLHSPFSPDKRLEKKRDQAWLPLFFAVRSADSLSLQQYRDQLTLKIGPAALLCHPSQPPTWHVHQLMEGP